MSAPHARKTDPNTSSERNYPNRVEEMMKWARDRYYSSARTLSGTRSFTDDDVAEALEVERNVAAKIRQGAEERGAIIRLSVKAINRRGQRVMQFIYDSNYERNQHAHGK